MQKLRGVLRQLPRQIQCGSTSVPAGVLLVFLCSLSAALANKTLAVLPGSGSPDESLSRAAPPIDGANSGLHVGRYTGLTLPRFAALRSDKVNLRRGPGRRYPIKWILQRQFLPVEILREFQDWRFLRIPDGTNGWVHRALLIGRRSFIVVGSSAALKRSPKGGALAAAVF